MKKYLLSVLCILVSLGCLAQSVRQPQNLFIANSDGQVKIQALDDTQTTGGLPWLVFGSQTNTVFVIPSTGILPVAYGGTGSASVSAAKTAIGLQAGSTNTSAAGLAVIRFIPVFTSTPVITLTPLATNVTCFVSSANPTNATIFLSSSNSVNWIAVGAP